LNPAWTVKALLERVEDDRATGSTDRHHRPVERSVQRRSVGEAADLWRMEE
jgi:hypothetical protein